VFLSFIIIANIIVIFMQIIEHYFGVMFFIFLNQVLLKLVKFIFLIFSILIFINLHLTFIFIHLISI